MRSEPSTPAQEVGSWCKARVEVHHAPWPLQRATMDVRVNDIPAAAGLRPLDNPPVCHCTTGVTVVSYAPEVIRP